MMKKPKWGSWLVAGALAVNLLLPAVAGAGRWIGKLEPVGPREGDPDTPSPTGGATNSLRTSTYLEGQLTVSPVPGVLIRVEVPRLVSILHHFSVWLR